MSNVVKPAYESLYRVVAAQPQNNGRIYQSEVATELLSSSYGRMDPQNEAMRFMATNIEYDLEEPRTIAIESRSTFEGDRIWVLYVDNKVDTVVWSETRSVYIKDAEPFEKARPATVRNTQTPVKR